MRKLILMQGAPGCGKSTVAEILRRHYETSSLPVPKVAVESADNYWYEIIEPHLPEKYSWDSERSGQNHVWNQKLVLEDMQNGYDVIIVDNTNTLRKEALPYIGVAMMFDYEISVVRVDPGVDVCIARQAGRPEDRRVPEEVIRAMHARMEDLI